MIYHEDAKKIRLLEKLFFKMQIKIKTFQLSHIQHIQISIYEKY